MLDEIVTVVKKCGDIILFADGAERNVSSKEGRANFVTKYDVAVQAYLEEELLKILPEAVFIGEEGEHSKAIGEGYAAVDHLKRPPFLAAHKTSHYCMGYKQRRFP